MSFKLWSELNHDALKNLKADWGIQDWDNLSRDEKSKIWNYLKPKYFFSIDDKEEDCIFQGYIFDMELIAEIIKEFNDLYKANSFGKNFLELGTDYAGCVDFYKIFMGEKGDVVVEMLSLTAKSLIQNTSTIESEWKYFDEFCQDFNEVTSHFGFNLSLTRLGFIPKQDKRILLEIYDPTLKILSHHKWDKVNQHLKDAFSEYRKNTQNGYSNCVTNTVTAVQAFLQIIVNGHTGTGDISTLIKKAQKDNQIPSDPFSSTIFKNIESILMQERQDTGIAHPKKEYATEKSARMVLNISMVFFQHCIL